jgi:hypothetical protein
MPEADVLVTAPLLIIRESLAHILRFSLSVAVLWVEYIPHAWVLLQSFPKPIIAFSSL